MLDVTATLEGRRALLDRVGRVAAQLFIPLAVGGGIRSMDDARAVIDAGADKVSLNSAALARSGPHHGHSPALYGSQAVIVAIDAKRGPATASRCSSRSGTAREVARRRRLGARSGGPRAPARFC